jgi:hypothetical protein
VLAACICAVEAGLNKFTSSRFTSGQLPDIRRRSLLKSGGLLVATAVVTGCGGSDAQGATRKSPAAALPTARSGSRPPLPTSSASSFYDVPSRIDEQNTYSNVLGWTWDAADKAFDFVPDPGVLTSSIDIHGDTEGDDLWTWYQQYLRTGSPLARTWAQRWRDYFVNVYLTDVVQDDARFDYDHIYGSGLVLWGVKEGDSAALAAAEAIGEIAMSESGASPSSTGALGSGGGRGSARWTILATYLAQALGTAKWINWRNALFNRYARSSSWEEAPTRGIVKGGHYFVSRRTYLEAPNWNNTGTVASYDAGRRLNSTFIYGLHAEAVWRGYLATGRTDLRDKLIKMARFVEHYGHDPSHNPKLTSAYFGHEQGNHWHRDANAASATYDISVVNTLVWGYKLTGDENLLNRARAHFRQGTRWPEGAPGRTNRVALVGETDVYAFVDTRKNPERRYFTHNKGQLQYCYQLFENGGAPATAA